jgi:NADH-quinone oxidoreductase subunit F
MPTPTPEIVFAGTDGGALTEIAAYEAVGGFDALVKARGMSPDDVIAELNASNLRGRGGAFFPTGRKWSFVPKPDQIDKPHYLVINADESEPGTFKDREIMLRVPFRFLEGALIAAHAIEAKHVFVYIRGEYEAEFEVLVASLEQMRAKKLLGDVTIVVHRGAGAYICGEETALLESLEGHRGFPRPKPPYYPAVKGLYSHPTVLNNVETLCHLPHIIALGAEGYRAYGPPVLYSVSGHVVDPGVKELPLGTSLREIIFDHAGGLRPGRTLKAVFPGGSSSAIILPDLLDTPADFESLAKAGSMLGSSAIIVMDDSTCIPAVIRRHAEFYRDESCGKCTPCREGTIWLTQIFDRILEGRGRMEDLDLLDGIARNMTGTCFCLLGESVPPSLRASLKYFRPEFEHHIKTGTCDIRAAGGVPA